MRAFSRDLNLSSSFLSDILQGKKNPSTDKALEISQAIGWSWRETQIFLQTAQFAQTKSKKTKKFLEKELKKTEEAYPAFQSLKAHLFSPVSEWYYMALLELSELPGFKNDPEWVSQNLGISRDEAAQALKVMIAKRFLIQDADSRWSKSNHSIGDTPSEALRKLHRQHLANAAVALQKQEFHKRHFSGMTMAINSEKLPEAIELVREFRARMSQLLEDGPRDGVYHLAIQLFQLGPDGTTNSSGGSK